MTRNAQTDYLEWELEQYREADRQRIEREIERRREHERERREEYEAEARSAETWPEALRKQARLMRAEVDEYDTEHYFADGAAACERALELWPAIESEHLARLTGLRAAIQRIEAEIQAINDLIRQEVGMQLLVELQGEKRQGWYGVGQTLVNGGDPEEWLQW